MLALRCATLWPLLLALGCAGSRWAKEDADYAAKYPHHTDNVARMTKQAVDARHVKGKRGLYAGFAGSDEPFGAGAEAGLFAYPQEWLELRVGGALLGHEGDYPLSGGGIAGVRVQPPSRLAPFAGVNGYLGWAGTSSAETDGVDNDDDGLFDEPGESDHNFVLAVAPELGVHYWLTSRVRLTGSADYRLTSDGRGNDSLFYGASLAVLGRGQRSPPRGTGGDDDRDWSFAPATAAPTAISGEATLTLPPSIALPESPSSPTEETERHTGGDPSLTVDDVIYETQTIFNEM